jgi:hypothetical protein
MRSVFFLIGLLLSGVCFGQTTVEEVRDSGFRRAVVKAADGAAKAGDIRRLDAVKIRVATLSPAFLDRAKELAVVQMQASGSDLDGLPVDAEGKIEVARIDWDKLGDFLVKLLPLILQLIDMFSVIPAGVVYV